MLESTFYQKVRRGLEPHGLWLNRVENLVGVGDPDLGIIGAGPGIVPVELKYRGDFPKRCGTKVLGAKGLRPEQVAWWGRASRMGCRGWIFIGVAEAVFIVPGRFALGLNDQPIDSLKELADLWWIGSPGRWAEVTELIGH